MQSTVTLLAAGSLRRAFIPLCHRFTQLTGTHVDIHFGPAGLLRERIESGEPCAVFASANRQHPQTLLDAGRAREIALFARNTLILTARNSVIHKDADWLTLLRDSSLRLATSTPGCDPSGDYTWQMFDNINALEAGLGDTLKQRAIQLVGGRDSLSVPAGEVASAWVIREGLADLFIGYAHYATALNGCDDVRVVAIPAAQNIRCDYQLALLKEDSAARALYTFILSEEGQGYLRDAGFLSASE
jgi:molybdenum ABC transporter, periplasmic molybdate-binding protein